MSKRRTPREKRRHLNAQEEYSLGWTELQERADEEGWAYADSDDEQTTETWAEAQHGWRWRGVTDRRR